MQKAKISLYWPQMAADLKSLVMSCSACQEYASLPKTEPLIPTPIPDHPFQVLGTDLFHADGGEYLLTVDYFSKWITIDKLRQTRSCDVIAVLERIFSDFGIPETIRSDNGPQYSSSEFKQFLVKNGITHKTSSPEYPRYNGQAERMVQVAKSLVKKCNLEGKSFYAGLRALRNTPVADDLPTPAQMLQGRQLYELLPISSSELLPSTYDRARVRDLMTERMASMKDRHDEHVVREKPALCVGEKVRVNVGWQVEARGSGGSL